MIGNYSILTVLFIVGILVAIEAAVAKLADAHASGVCEGNLMRVQVSPAALTFGTKSLRNRIMHNRILDILVRQNQQIHLAN